MKNTTIISVIVLTSLVNIYIFSIIAQTKHPNEKYWIDKYQNCITECNDETRKTKILKTVETELNDKFVLKEDYIKLHHEYDIIFNSVDQLNEVVLKQYEFISQIKTYYKSLQNCQFSKCKEIEYKMYKLISEYKSN